MAKLTINNLNKIFDVKLGDNVHAVKDFNLVLEHGEILALLGSSGCGKTTTLRMVAGFESPTSGEIKCNDTDLIALPPAKRNVAMAFEGYALYPPLTVKDNISFGLMREKLSNAEIEKKVTEISDLLEINDILHRYPSTVSGGQAQRVSLARALVRTSDILLLDEPMSQLEPQLRAVLRARVKDYIQHNKKTTVFVTHDQTEAIALADKIAVMEGGELQQLASPFDIRTKPQNVFVASFIGEPPMNMLNAEYSFDDNKIHFHIKNEKNDPAFKISYDKNNIDQSKIANLSNNQKLVVGIRPQKINFNTSSSNHDAKIQLTSNHWLGDQIHLGFELNGVNIIGVADRNFEVQEGLNVNFTSGSINLFDSNSEKVIFNGF
jgi:multiple sugar transport system ATP-binding protein